MVATFRQLYAITIPPDMTNIWGVSEAIIDGKKYFLLDGFSDQVEHRLASATWNDVLWLDEEWRHSFLGLVFDLACNLGTMAGSGRRKAKEQLSVVVPEDLAECVEQIRTEHHVSKDRGMADIGYEKGVAWFKTSSEMRLLMWWPTKEADDTTQSRSGTLKVEFGLQGSHEFLKQLMRRFGVPQDALKPLQQS